MTDTAFREELLVNFIQSLFLIKKNLAGARFKEGVNNKINLYHLWYIATTLLPYDDYHETTAPTSIHRTKFLTEKMKLQRLNNGIGDCAC